MTQRRLATKETVGGLKVGRVRERAIYGTLGAEYIRHHAAPDVLMRCLVSLGYVIEEADLRGLPAEAERVAAFGGGRHRTPAVARPGLPERASTSKRPMRRVEPERPRLRRTLLSDAAKAGEPAYPLGPRFAGPRQGLARGAPPPSIPKDARAPLRCACSPIVRAVSGRARWSLAQAAPLALNGACRRGPRSPPRHRRSPRPRRRRAGGRHDGEVVLGERTGDAVRDGGTHRSLPRQRRGKLGVQGGRNVPLARPQCFTLVLST